MTEKLKESIFDSFKGSKKEIIPLLQKMQEEQGYLSKEAVKEIAEFVREPESRIYEVATFYAQFRFSPVGEKHIMVCRGTACHVKGAPSILGELERRLGIKEGETTPDGKFSLETVACIGACGMAPTMVINKATHGRLTVKRAAEILKDAGLQLKGVQDG